MRGRGGVVRDPARVVRDAAGRRGRPRVVMVLLPDRRVHLLHRVVALLDVAVLVRVSCG